MNVSKIHADVVAVLQQNPDKVAGRRAAIAALKLGLAQELNPPLPRRRRAWFSTTQSQTTSAKGGARVQVLGLDAGELRFEATAHRYEFHPNAKLFPEHRGHHWAWSKSADDAKRIRDYLAKCEEHPKASFKNEREIQWRLANALGRKTPALRNLGPVKWHGRATEIGVSINKKGDIGTGNIDLVVRRGAGGDRGYLVFEVKAPGDTNIEAALVQALRYASALHVEANLGSAANRANYNAVFESTSTAKLTIGAVVVMEDSASVRAKASRLLAQYWGTTGDSPIDRLGVLLYRLGAKGTLSWDWLPDWDARQRRPKARGQAPA